MALILYLPSSPLRKLLNVELPPPERFYRLFPGVGRTSASVNMLQKALCAFRGSCVKSKKCPHLRSLESVSVRAEDLEKKKNLGVCSSKRRELI